MAARRSRGSPVQPDPIASRLTRGMNAALTIYDHYAYEVLDLLGPGIGPANTEVGLPRLREVVNEMRALIPSVSGDSQDALHEAISALGQVEQLYASGVT